MIVIRDGKYASTLVTLRRDPCGILAASAQRVRYIVPRSAATRGHSSISSYRGPYRFERRIRSLLQIARGYSPLWTQPVLQHDPVRLNALAVCPILCCRLNAPVVPEADRYNTRIPHYLCNIVQDHR